MYAFLLHADHWLSSEKTRTMTLAQRGAYIDLLCIQWQSGSIPKDQKALAGLLGVSPKEFARVWRKPLTDCFVADPENGQRLVNLRLIAETETFLKRRARFQAGGIKGNLKRWQKESPSDHQAITKRSPSVSLPDRNTNTNIYREDYNSQSARDGEASLRSLPDGSFELPNGVKVPKHIKAPRLKLYAPDDEALGVDVVDESDGRVYNWDGSRWYRVAGGAK
jgi:uncharacterized protein YdaU (DUF1376 family)